MVCRPVSAPLEPHVIPDIIVPDGAPGAFCYDAATHLGLTLGVAGFFALSETVIKPQLRGPDAAPVDAAGPIDALLPARSHRAWRTASNVTLYTALAAPMLLAPTLLPSGLAQAAGDTLMVYETVCLANALTDLVKFSVRRPRPDACGLAATNVERLLSFPSGHTSVVAAVAGALVVASDLRGGSGLTTLVTGVGAALLTVITACGRVRGDMHYLSDVLGGAMLGATVGWVWPRLHRC